MNMKHISDNCYGTEELTEAQKIVLDAIIELAANAGLSMRLIELETYEYSWYPLDVEREKYNPYHPDGLLIKFSQD